MTELEKIGLIPRSIVRMLDRFYYQIYLGTAEPLVKQFRFSKYLLLTSVKSLFLVLFIPFFINIFTKIYIFRPIVEYFWDRKQPEIFLNYELQEKAFLEIHKFEEKIYFDYLIKTENGFFFDSPKQISRVSLKNSVEDSKRQNRKGALASDTIKNSIESDAHYFYWAPLRISNEKNADNKKFDGAFFSFRNRFNITSNNDDFVVTNSNDKNAENSDLYRNNNERFSAKSGSFDSDFLFDSFVNEIKSQTKLDISKSQSLNQVWVNQVSPINTLKETYLFNQGSPTNGSFQSFLSFCDNPIFQNKLYFTALSNSADILQYDFSKNTEFLFRKKTRELANHYNNESISALTNLLADFMGLLILLFLLVNMKMSLMNTTAFLSESFFSLKDSKKAFLMLLFTDLLVGFHSPRGWEVIFHFLFEHFGLPENHNIIFLLVGTFPVLLDALFKYWIFRHLNRHSPATVATFQAMVE